MSVLVSVLGDRVGVCHVYARLSHTRISLQWKLLLTDLPFMLLLTFPTLPMKREGDGEWEKGEEGGGRRERRQQRDKDSDINNSDTIMRRRLSRQTIQSDI